MTTDWREVAKEFGDWVGNSIGDGKTIKRMAEEIIALRGQLPNKRKGPKSSKDFAYSLQFHKELSEMQKKEIQAMQEEIARLRDRLEMQSVVAITDGPIVSENITIDQRFRFEQQLKAERAYSEKLRSLLAQVWHVECKHCGKRLVAKWEEAE